MRSHAVVARNQQGVRLDNAPAGLAKGPGALIRASRLARGPDRPLPPHVAARPSYGARAVGSYVSRVTAKSFEKFGFSTASLLTDWAAIVGADLARFTAPERVKWPRRTDGSGDDGTAGRHEGATLVLRVDGPRALEVQYKSRLILDRINAFFGFAAVTTLRVMQAPVTELARSTAGRRPLGEATRLPVAPPPPAVAAVECDGLRDALVRLHSAVAGRPR